MTQAAAVASRPALPPAGTNAVWLVLTDNGSTVSSAQSQRNLAYELAVSAAIRDDAVIDGFDEGDGILGVGPSRDDIRARLVWMEEADARFSYPLAFRGLPNPFITAATVSSAAPSSPPTDTVRLVTSAPQAPQAAPVYEPPAAVKVWCAEISTYGRLGPFATRVDAETASTLLLGPSSFDNTPSDQTSVDIKPRGVRDQIVGRLRKGTIIELAAYFNKILQWVARNENGTWSHSMGALGDAKNRAQRGISTDGGRWHDIHNGADFVVNGRVMATVRAEPIPIPGLSTVRNFYTCLASSQPVGNYGSTNVVNAYAAAAAVVLRDTNVTFYVTPSATGGGPYTFTADEVGTARLRTLSWLMTSRGLTTTPVIQPERAAVAAGVLTRAGAPFHLQSVTGGVRILHNAVVSQVQGILDTIPQQLAEIDQAAAQAAAQAETGLRAQIDQAMRPPVLVGMDDPRVSGMPSVAVCAAAVVGDGLAVPAWVPNALRIDFNSRLVCRMFALMQLAKTAQAAWAGNDLGTGPRGVWNLETETSAGQWGVHPSGTPPTLWTRGAQELGAIPAGTTVHTQTFRAFPDGEFWDFSAQVRRTAADGAGEAYDVWTGSLSIAALKVLLREGGWTARALTLFDGPVAAPTAPEASTLTPGR